MIKLDEAKDRKVIDGWYEEARSQTPATLMAFFEHLADDYGHDYGTVVHALAAAAIAAAWAFNATEQGGITGFQASAVGLEFIKHWQGIAGPFRIQRMEELLYPQYLERLTPIAISRSTQQWLQKEASEKLKALADSVNPHVQLHWELLAAGKLPTDVVVKG